MERSDNTLNTNQSQTDDSVQCIPEQTMLPPKIYERDSQSASFNKEGELDPHLDISLPTPLETFKVYLRIKPTPPTKKLTKMQEEAYKVVSSTTLLTKLPCMETLTRPTKEAKTNGTLSRKFYFTQTFGPAATQVQLFQEAVRQQMVNFIAGGNSTVMTYGTTNSGKSYTLQGTASCPGIIPQAIEFVFFHMGRSSSPCYKPVNQGGVLSLNSAKRAYEIQVKFNLLSSVLIDENECTECYNSLKTFYETESPAKIGLRGTDVNYSVWVSFAEIYNETILDLLSNESQDKMPPLKLVTDKQGRTFIRELKMVCVTSGLEAYQLFMVGQCRLKVAVTALNDKSSRSHSIFTMKLLKWCTEKSGAVEVSTISFCDLAGSSRLKKSFAGNSTYAKESQNINSSLLVLGRCLKATWDHQSMKQKADVVGPFRESKLTRLFQRALSGRERIALFVNVNPSPNMYVETQSVLHLSAFARKIVINPIEKLEHSLSLSEVKQVRSQSEDHDMQDLKLLAQIPEKSKCVICKSWNETMEENGKLKEEIGLLGKELAAMKSSYFNRDLEVRQEMANIYTGMLKDVENNWKSHAEDVQEQQDDLLKWSVNQVENFYKKKLSQLNSRKRRRTSDGDHRDDEEVSFEVLKAEQDYLTKENVSLRKALKEFKVERVKMSEDGDKRLFELALAKEKVTSLQKMLKDAQSNILYDKEANSPVEQFEKDIDGKDNQLKTVVQRPGKLRAEYEKQVSYADSLEFPLVKPNNMKNGNVIEQRKNVERLSDELKFQSMQLAMSEDRTQIAENEYSQPVTLELMSSERSTQLKEMQRELNEVSEIKEISSNNGQKTITETEYLHELSKDHSSVDDNPKYQNENLASKKESSSVPALKQSMVELENLMLKEKLSSCNNKMSMLKIDLAVTKKEIAEVGRLVEDLKVTDSIKVETFDANTQTDSAVVEGRSQASLRSSDSDSRNDSGIVVTANNSSQTLESYRKDSSNLNDLHEVESAESSNRTKPLTDEVDDLHEQLDLLKLDYNEVKTQCLYETLRVKELSDELQDSKWEIEALQKSSDSNESKLIEYEDSFIFMKAELECLRAEIKEGEIRSAQTSEAARIKASEYEQEMHKLENRLDLSLENEKRFSISLEECTERAASLESQLSVAYLQLERTAIKCYTEHVPKIEKLEKEICEARLQEKINEPHLDKRETLRYNRDSIKTSELNAALLKEIQKGKEGLQRQEYEHLKKLSSLEEQLQFLTAEVQEREIKIKNQQTELNNAVQKSASNCVIMQNLEAKITEISRKLVTIQEELFCCDEARRCLEEFTKKEMDGLEERLKPLQSNAKHVSELQEIVDNKQAESDRLRIQLQDREHEMCVFRKNRDETIQRYEALVKELQESAEKSEQEKKECQEQLQKGTANVEEVERLKEEITMKTILLDLLREKIRMVTDLLNGNENHAIAAGTDITLITSESVPVSDITSFDSFLETKRNIHNEFDSTTTSSTDTRQELMETKLSIPAEEDGVDLKPCEILGNQNKETMASEERSVLRRLELSSSETSVEISGINTAVFGWKGRARRIPVRSLTAVSSTKIRRPKRKMNLLVQKDEVCIDLEPSEGYAMHDQKLH